MPATAPEPTVAQQLDKAIDDLKTALARASEATACIKALLPEVVDAGSVLDEISALVRNGRSRAPLATPSLVPATAATRSALAAAPAPAQHARADEPQSVEVEATGPEELEPASPQPLDAAGTVCFRIEFESAAGPLDLRTVDDAISAHPAVRDVALLDYDGHRAALKVWITAGTTPAEVQSDLKQRIPQLFSSQDEVSIVALEDVA